VRTVKTLLLATQNPKKGKELDELARGAFTVRTLKDVGLADLVIVEDAPTFEGNARKKVDAVYAALTPAQRDETYAILGDDSGLVVDALGRADIGGRPGVRSARFAEDAGLTHLGPTADAANNALLLTMMSAVPDEQRAARFVSCVCARIVAANPAGQASVPAPYLEARGAVEGTIARDLIGGGGFGYDPLFICSDEPATGKRMAELTADQKHAISHRGRAMRVLLKQLT
jgi:XTP/dITP diphosphohydrolase